MRSSEKTLGELIMKTSWFLFPLIFSSVSWNQPRNGCLLAWFCHTVLQLALFQLHYEMKFSYRHALVLLHTLVIMYLQSSLLKFLIKLEDQLLQINQQGLDWLEPRLTE